MVCHIVCAWCGRLMGDKECEFQGRAEDAVTHTICPACAGKVLAAIDAAVDLRAARRSAGKTLRNVRGE